MANHKSFNSLANRLKEIGENVPKRATKEIRRAALAGDVAVVVATPVDTGHARSRWIIRIGMEPPVDADFKSIEAIPGAAATEIAIDEAKEVLNFWEVGKGDIFISNPLPYAEKLNEGFSQQAPLGMTDDGIAAIIDAIKQSKLLVTSRG